MKKPNGQSEYPYEDSAHAPVREWYKRHVQWFGKPPGQPTTAGYTGLHYFALAAQKAGKDLTREKFIDALEGVDRVPEPTFNGPPITRAMPHMSCSGPLRLARLTLVTPPATWHRMSPDAAGDSLHSTPALL